jgi:fibro-slime domain-containing protein
MRSQRALSICTWGALAAAGGVAFILPDGLGIQSAAAQVSPYMDLTGLIRDFRESHSDFGPFVAANYAHVPNNVNFTTDSGGRPSWKTGGFKVASNRQWKDYSTNNIAPHLYQRMPDVHLGVDYPLPTVNGCGNKTVACRVYCANPEIIKGVGMYLAAPPSTSVRFALYTDSAGNPGTLLRQSVTAPEGTPGMPPKFIERLFTSPVSVAAGYYWIAVTNNMPNPNFYRGPGTGTIKIKNNNYTPEPGFPNSFGAASSTISGRMSFYAVCEPKIVNCGGVHDTMGTPGVASNASVSGELSFATWFRDVPGVNQSGLHRILLRRNGSGVYEYLNNNFWPIDGLLLGNEVGQRNPYFTYEIDATFTYDACAGQFLQFEGADDCWMFIDGRMVIDLGGLSPRIVQHLQFDRHGMIDGTVHRLQIFYAQRNASTSVFRLRTNVPLTTSLMPAVTAAFD